MFEWFTTRARDLRTVNRALRRARRALARLQKQAADDA